MTIRHSPLSVAVCLAILLACVTTSVTRANTVVFRDIPHFPSGVASLTLVGTPETGTLVVANLGPSGWDGVSALLNNACQYGASWEPLSTLQQGSILRVRVHGELDQVPDQVLGTVSFTHSGPSVEIAVDLPPATSLLNQMRIEDGFQTVYQDLIEDVGLAATADTYPEGFSVESACSDVIASSIRFFWSTPTTIVIPGGPTVMADAIEITSAAFLSNFSQVDVVASSGFGSLTITDASSGAPGATPVIETPPRRLVLDAGVPNPFNPRTEIGFTLPSDAFARLTVHDARGQHVKTLVNVYSTAGSHVAIWNGTDDSGKSVGSGTYFVRLQSGPSTRTQKVTLVR